MALRDLGKALASPVLNRLGRAASRFQEETPLPVDVLESEDAFLVVFDAPGATASDVQVRFRDNEVTVQVDRFREVDSGSSLRYPGRGLRLDGRATLPEDAGVDPTSARAELRDNGTLHVTLPKDTGDDNTGEAQADD